MSAQKNNLPYIVKGHEFRNVKLLDSKNVFHQEISLRTAVEMSKQEDLDVVCFTEGSGKELPFCKIINFGKWKYSEEKKKKKQNKEHKKATKEIRISIDISDHDLEHKIKQTKEFLIRGDDVIFSMFLKGRQRLRLQDAIMKMDSIKEICSDFGVESARKNEVPNLVLRLSPSNKKHDKEETVEKEIVYE